MGIEFLGRGGNVIPVASGKHISLKNASGVTFVLYEDAGAQATAFKESIGGASEAALGVVNDYYAGDGVGGVWTHETADASAALDDNSTFTKKDTTAFDCAVIYIGADQLSAGFDSVEATVDGGQCIAIVHDLKVQRAPQNLPASAV